MNALIQHDLIALTILRKPPYSSTVQVRQFCQLKDCHGTVRSVTLKMQSLEITIATIILTVLTVRQFQRASQNSYQLLFKVKNLQISANLLTAFPYP